jgi:hypothetical protein
MIAVASYASCRWPDLELEALICHVYAVDADGFELLFDLFQHIKRVDLDEHGYYRTREEIKAEYERLADQITMSDGEA